MDLAMAFNETLQIINSASDAESGWKSLYGYLSRKVGNPLPDLASVQIARDIEDVHSQIEQLMQSHPLPSNADAIYFGLFDTVNDAGIEGIGYYIAGVSGFDPDDGDSLCDPIWWPEGRYLSSTTLDSVKKAEVAANTLGDKNTERFLGYAGQLGTALLISRFASANLAGKFRRVVGFDSGDFAELSP
jgi:hypothetical protein